MKPVVFIDGREGTTGLQIHDRLAPRRDIELLILPEEKRKDVEARRYAINRSDLVFLCLPDDAARQSVSLLENPHTQIIDASTAHRTAPDWVYGFPELSPAQRESIRAARFVANPGCHATGFISAVHPLVQKGILPHDYPLCVCSLTGYSGGGKPLIAEYEDPNRDQHHKSHRIYALDVHHKHLPEMQKLCELSAPPVFQPVLGDFYRGMATSVYLHNAALHGQPGAADIRDILAEYYDGEVFVSVAPLGGDAPMLYADTYANTNSLRLVVCGHEDQTIITALFDNLGKGASGAAVQNMNLMLGFSETEGLPV